MKGFYHSEITVTGPSKLSQVLPFPACNAPKGADGLPLYYKEIAVLAFPQSPDQCHPRHRAVINLSEKMDRDGRLTWDVPPGSWVIARFITSNTGQKLMVPSPNSSGLLIDHLDANAAETHLRHIIDQILKTRPSLDACATWKSIASRSTTRRTGPIPSWRNSASGVAMIPSPICPRSRAKRFADPQITAAFSARLSQDRQRSVDRRPLPRGHEISEPYGMQLVAEAGHGGDPRTEPLRACGAVDIPRGEFWNGSQFWVVKEVASAAHIYGRQIVDAESFTGWRQLAGRAAGIQAAGRYRVLRRAESHHVPHLRAYSAQRWSARKHVSRRRTLQRQLHLVAQSRAHVVLFLALLLSPPAGPARGGCLLLLRRRRAQPGRHPPDRPGFQAAGRRHLRPLREAQPGTRRRARNRLRLRRHQLRCDRKPHGDSRTAA